MTAGQQSTADAAAPVAPPALQDEYGQLDCSGETWVCPELRLESGVIMRQVQVKYNTYGELNKARDNAVLVFHALTGNSNLASWWGGMLGAGRPLDPTRHFVVCANCLGSCYGTTGPSSPDPQNSGAPYGSRFPRITIRDTVTLTMTLLQRGLGVCGLAAAVGGSMGAMQVLEAALSPIVSLRPRALVVICAGGRHSPWQVGFSEVQRQAITSDPKWRGGDYPDSDPPAQGLSLARQIAMLTYRSHASVVARFTLDESGAEGGEVSPRRRDHEDPGVIGYLHAQGKKLLERRFDARTYMCLINLLDTHDISRGRGAYLDVLRSITQPALVVSVRSDVLYPPSEQVELATNMPRATLLTLDSPEGHDGFFLSQDELGAAIVKFLATALAPSPQPLVLLPPPLSKESAWGHG
eukprot:RCo020383